MPEPEFDNMTPFEQWFYGCGAYADGDLCKDADGTYKMPLTQVYFECWNVAQLQVLNQEK